LYGLKIIIWCSPRLWMKFRYTDQLIVQRFTFLIVTTNAFMPSEYSTRILWKKSLSIFLAGVYYIMMEVQC